MIHAKEYIDQCWWCGSPAGSGEHKFKQTELKQEFGNHFKDRDVIKTLGDFDLETAIHIQGPNSDLVKFDKNIFCKSCNNDRSKEMDAAYDKFISYVKANENLIFETHTINLIEIYGEFYLKEFLNLLRYYTKNICCRFAELKISIAPDIIDFLDKKKEHPSSLGMQFEIRTDWVEFYKYLKSNNEDYGYTHASGVGSNKPRHERGYLNLYGQLQYRWLKLSYNYDSSKKYGMINGITNGKLALIESYNVHPKEMKEKMKNAR